MDAKVLIPDGLSLVNTTGGGMVKVEINLNKDSAKESKSRHQIY